MKSEMLKSLAPANSGTPTRPRGESARGHVVNRDRISFVFSVRFTSNFTSTSFVLVDKTLECRSFVPSVDMIRVPSHIAKTPPGAFLRWASGARRRVLNPVTPVSHHVGDRQAEVAYRRALSLTAERAALPDALEDAPCAPRAGVSVTASSN